MRTTIRRDPHTEIIVEEGFAWAKASSPAEIDGAMVVLSSPSAMVVLAATKSEARAAIAALEAAIEHLPDEVPS